MTDRNAEARPSAAEAADRLRLAAGDPTTAIALTTSASLEPTQKMRARLLSPEHTMMPTEALDSGTASAPATETTVAMPMASFVAPERRAPARTMRRKPAIVAAIVAGALLFVGAGAVLGVQLAAPTAVTAPTTEPPTFPEVGGTLGDHLQQLQQSVAP
jgi:hypothetical protein